jgi:ketosteroid isomerase-like protein
MPRLSRFFLIAVFALTGCASEPAGKPVERRTKGIGQIQSRLNEIIAAAEHKDFVRLDSYHLYASSFTKFAPEASTRLGADAARKGEHDGLAAATDLKMRADELKVDLFDNVGIATFVLNYSFKSSRGIVEKSANTTMVFVKDHGSWKIAHEHLSTPKPVP